MTLLNWVPKHGRWVVEIIHNGNCVAYFFNMRDAQAWCKQQ